MKQSVGEEPDLDPTSSEVGSVLEEGLSKVNTVAPAAMAAQRWAGLWPYRAAAGCTLQSRAGAGVWQSRGLPAPLPFPASVQGCPYLACSLNEMGALPGGTLRTF